MSSSEYAKDCLHFTGYKPCSLNKICNQFECRHYSQNQGIVLLIHLGALGAVVRSTGLLRGLRQKHPHHKLFWLTDSPADQLLSHHPSITKVFTSDWRSYQSLLGLEFAHIYVLDKSLKAIGLAASLRTTPLDKESAFQTNRWGFGCYPQTGAIVPITEGAQELYHLGLDNHKKFFVNRKSELQLSWEALELGDWSGCEYDLPLTPEEKDQSQAWRKIWSDRGQRTVVGWNTGCSPTLPAKKWTVEYHQKLIRETLRKWETRVRCVLLGGREDLERNREIQKPFGNSVVLSEMDQGLRSGLMSVEACDVVVSGDSLGMHLAIARSKFTVAWFGPTCSQEIDLGPGGGVKIHTRAECSPCWNPSCRKPVMCYDLVNIFEVLSALEIGIEKNQTQQKILEPSSSEEAFPDSLLSHEKSLTF